jgi:hypothetical protein
MNDKHVHDRVAIGVLKVGVGALGDEQTHTLFLAQTGCKTEWVFPPVHISVKKKNTHTHTHTHTQAK